MKNEERENTGLEYIKELMGKVDETEGFKQYKEEKNRKKNSKGALDLIDPEYITFTVKKTERISLLTDKEKEARDRRDKIRNDMR